MLTYVGAPLLFLILWDVAVVLGYNLLGWKWLGSSDLPLALYGSVIGLVVGFRNNSSYARWWEARTLWGSIVNNSRSLGRQICAIPEGDSDLIPAVRHRLIHLQIAFTHALRQALRGLSPQEE